jgi:hypothetical protein
MKPKEKAIELVNKFYIEGDMLKESHSYRLAKKCALIAVDEIMQALSVIDYGMQYLAEIDYWEEVKKEIENL